MAREKLRYTPQPNIPDDEEGRLKYLSDELNKIAAQFSNMRAVLAGYGGVKTEVSTPMANIGLAFQTIPAEAKDIEIPLYVIQDVDNDGIAMQIGGAWQVSIGLELYHNEVTAANPRSLILGIFNATESELYRTVDISVAKNTDVTLFTATFLIDLEEELIGDLFTCVLYSATDTFTTVSVERYNFSAVHVSP